MVHEELSNPYASFQKTMMRLSCYIFVSSFQSCVFHPQFHLFVWIFRLVWTIENPYVISPIKTAAVANAVLAVLETKRQKARDWYAKLTDEQKAQRNAKRREAYAMEKCKPRCVRSLLMLVITWLPINLNMHNLFTQFITFRRR